MRLTNAQMILNAGSALLLGLFLARVSPLLVNSDSAATILLADELVKAGTLLSRQWVYVSDSLSLDGRVQVAMLGAALWGPSVKTFIFTGAAGAIFSLLASYWLARLLQASRANAVTAALVLLLGPSLIYQDLVLGLGITMQIGLVLLFVGCFIRYAFLRGPMFHLLVALAIVFLMSVSSPKKAAAYVLVPVVAAIALHLMTTRAGGQRAVQDRRRMWWGMPAVVTAAAIGSFIHAKLLAEALHNSSYARLDLVLTPAHALANLKTAGTLLVRFAGGGEGGTAALAVATALSALAIIMVAPLMRGRRSALSGPAGFASAYGVLGTLGVLGYILVYEDIKIFYGIYYLLIPFSPLLAVAASVASEPDFAGGRRVGASAVRAALVAMLLLGAINAGRALLDFPDAYFGISKNQKATHSEQMQAIAWLRQHGLRHGFANYWDANAITLLSDGAIQVTSALTPAGGGEIRRHGWLSSISRINYTPREGEWFIAVPKRRRAVVMPEDCLPAKTQAEVGGYRIFVYEGALQGCLPPPMHFRREARSAARRIRDSD